MHHLGASSLRQASGRLLSWQGDDRFEKRPPRLRKPDARLDQYLAPSPDLAAHQASLGRQTELSLGGAFGRSEAPPLPERFLRKWHVCIEGFRSVPTNQCEMQSVMIELLIGAV
jgi:hypothetical protein